MPSPLWHFVAGVQEKYCSSWNQMEADVISVAYLKEEKNPFVSKTNWSISSLSRTFLDFFDFFVSERQVNTVYKSQ